MKWGQHKRRSQRAPRPSFLSVDDGNGGQRKLTEAEIAEYKLLTDEEREAMGWPRWPDLSVLRRALGLGDDSNLFRGWIMGDEPLMVALKPPTTSTIPRPALPENFEVLGRAASRLFGGEKAARLGRNRDRYVQLRYEMRQRPVEEWAPDQMEEMERVAIGILTEVGLDIRLAPFWLMRTVDGVWMYAPPLGKERVDPKDYPHSMGPLGFCEMPLENMEYSEDAVGAYAPVLWALRCLNSCGRFRLAAGQLVNALPPGEALEIAIDALSDIFVSGFYLGHDIAWYDAGARLHQNEQDRIAKSRSPEQTRRDELLLQALRDKNPAGQPASRLALARQLLDEMDHGSTPRGRELAELGLSDDLKKIDQALARVECQLD